MLISVIIPIYNVQDFLERCVNSVVKTNADEVEIVLVDDGSTDRSSNICDEYVKKYRNIKVIHQQNGGLSVARNAGIDVASGEYLVFLDSDDMLDESFLKDMIRIINQYEPDMISFLYCHEYKKNDYKVRGEKTITVTTPFNYFERILNNKLGSQICFHVYKRKLFDGLFFPIGCYYEDIRIFWKLVSRAKSIIDIDYTYYIYNMTNQGAITKNVSIKSMEDMKCSIDIMIQGIIDTLDSSKKLTAELTRCAQYARLNGYVYILYKIKNSRCKNSALKDELKKYIKSTHVNLLKYRNYDWKKYIVCKGLMKMGKI